MKIRGILKRRYKSQRNFHMEDIDDLAMLIGGNRSGKTNLFEALVLFFSGLEWTSALSLLLIANVERLFTWNKIVVHDRAWKRL